MGKILPREWTWKKYEKIFPIGLSLPLNEMNEQLIGEILGEDVVDSLIKYLFSNVVWTKKMWRDPLKLII